MPYGGGYSDLSSKNNALNQCNFIKNSKKGAILIEFAFAVPVLFSLIYYIQDLHHLKHIQQRMNFVATEMVSILQNISHAITEQDLANAMQVAYLSVFPGNTMDGKITNPVSYPLGYYPYIHIMFVKGEANNQASCKWLFRLWGGGNKYVISPGLGSSSLKYSSGTVAASSFWPTLTISEGEYKIILQCALYYDHAGKFGETFFNGPHRGKKCAQVPARSAFGFYIIDPITVARVDDAFFHATVIFTPKPGLFSETMSQ